MDPPGDNSGRTSSRPWLSSADESRTSESGGGKARPAKLVGKVVDPSVDGDGLGLSGPGAPSSFGKNKEHPVRARLLEKARQAEAGSDPNPQAEHEVSSERAPSPSWEEESEEDAALPPNFGSEVSGPDAAERYLGQRREMVSSRSNDQPDEASPFPSGEPSSRTPPPGAVLSELDRIARRKPIERSGPGLSPNMIAILGGLVGLTVISTLGVFLSGTKVDAPTEAAEKVETKAPPPEKKQATAEAPKRTKVAGPWRVEDDAQKPGHRLLQGKVGKNAFLRAIQDAGLPTGEAYRAYNALKDLKDLDHCKPADSFVALVQGSAKSLVGFEYIVSKEEVYQAKANEQGKFVGEKLDLKVERNQIRRAFTHDGKSFEDSARRAGFDPGLASEAEKALRGHASLSEFKRGDRLRVIAQEVTVLGEFARYSGIEALEIVRAGQDPTRVYYYPHPVEGGYFDRTGKAPYEGGWRKPIPDAVRTSPFNPKRLHPTLKKVMPHNGTDFGCVTGTPIGATSPGTISVRGQGGGYGNLIRIKHEGGYESGYAHLSRFENGLGIGDRVERMQVIGYCGSTGRSTGPHLHFEIKKDGKFIDPESLSLDGLRVLPKAHREEFSQVQTKYDPILDAIPLPAPLPAEVAQVSSPTGPPAGDVFPEEDSAQATAIDPGADEEDQDEPEAFGMMEEHTAARATTADATPNPGAPSMPSMPAKAQSPNAIFLSDADLLKMQSLTDDGEVSE